MPNTNIVTPLLRILYTGGMDDPTPPAGPAAGETEFHISTGPDDQLSFEELSAPPDDSDGVDPDLEIPGVDDEPEVHVERPTVEEPVETPAPAFDPSQFIPKADFDRVISQIGSMEKLIDRQAEELGTMRAYTRTGPGALQPKASEERPSLFVEDDDARIMQSPSAAMNHLYATVIEQAPSMIQEIVNESIARVEYERNVRTTFFDSYPHLKDKIDVVGMISARVQRANPRTPMIALLPKVAEECDKWLESLAPGSLKTQTTIPKTPGTKPRAVPKKKTKQPSVNDSELANTLAFVDGQ